MNFLLQTFGIDMPIVTDATITVPIVALVIILFSLRLVASMLKSHADDRKMFQTSLQSSDQARKEERETYNSSRQQLVTLIDSATNLNEKVAETQQQTTVAIALLKESISNLYGQINKGNEDVRSSLFDVSTAVARLSSDSKQLSDLVKSAVQELPSSISNGLLVLSGDGTVVGTNAYACELLGLSASDLINVNISKLPVVLYNFRRQILSDTERVSYRVLDTKAPVLNNLVGVASSKTPTVSWLLVDGFPHFSKENPDTVLAILLVLRPAGKIVHSTTAEGA